LNVTYNYFNYFNFGALHGKMLWSRCMSARILAYGIGRALLVSCDDPVMVEHITGVIPRW